MTNRELVLYKLANLAEQASRVKRRRGRSLEAYLRKAYRQDALSMNLLVALQEAADIAMHIVADERWGHAKSYADSFELLAANRVIDEQLAQRMKAVASVRNRIAHLYGTVDHRRLWEELPGGLAALDEFASAIARFVQTR